MCSPVNAYHETVKKFVAVDPVDVAARSGSYYNKDRGIFEIVYLGNAYMIERDGRVWRGDNPGEEVAFNDKTLILQYLCEASGIPPRGSWISFLELPLRSISDRRHRSHGQFIWNFSGEVCQGCRIFRGPPPVYGGLFFPYTSSAQNTSGSGALGGRRRVSG